MAGGMSQAYGLAPLGRWLKGKTIRYQHSPIQIISNLSKEKLKENNIIFDL
jgi:hypothetical protein